jgi:hypothetical protein
MPEAINSGTDTSAMLEHQLQILESRRLTMLLGLAATSTTFGAGLFSFLYLKNDLAGGILCTIAAMSTFVTMLLFIQNEHRIRAMTPQATNTRLDILGTMAHKAIANLTKALAFLSSIFALNPLRAIKEESSTALGVRLLLALGAGLSGSLILYGDQKQPMGHVTDVAATGATIMVISFLYSIYMAIILLLRKQNLADELPLTLTPAQEENAHRALQLTAAGETTPLVRKVEHAVINISSFPNLDKDVDHADFNHDADQGHKGRGQYCTIQ